MGRLIKPHRRHLYQFLANERGIAHWKVSGAAGVAVGCWGMRVGCEADWGFRGFGVVGCLVWWVCVGELCCAEEFTELAADTRRHTETFLQLV